MLNLSHLPLERNKLLRSAYPGLCEDAKGLPLGFPTQVDSANRCYSNANHSLPAADTAERSSFNKINPLCEDMKNHQPSLASASNSCSVEKRPSVPKTHHVLSPHRDAQSPLAGLLNSTVDQDWDMQESTSFYAQKNTS